jgi:acyl dehydratase
MIATTILSVNRLRQHVGAEVGVSEWFEVTQDHINEFAEATGDRQWIHVDPDRARRESPFGRTIAHGFLTLSMLSRMIEETITITGMRMGLNYGFNRVRFTGPVPSGSRIRARFVLKALDDLEGGVQMTWEVSVEREGEAKPVLVAEWLTRRHD